MSATRTVLIVLAAISIAGCREHIAPAPFRVPGDGGVALESPEVGAAVSSTPILTRVPPVTGGNVLGLRSGAIAITHVASDALVITDEEGAVLSTVSLRDDAQPGRMVEDAAGLLHVVLRRTGELVTIDPVDGTELDRRAVCGAPRGLAYDAATDHVLVACAGGELVTLSAAQGTPTATIDLGPDLRDVVVSDGLVYVSRFRSAELITLSADGSVAEVRRPSVRTETDGSGGTVRLEPHVAYRLRAMPGGGVAMLHQRAVAPSGTPSSSYYPSAPAPGSAAPFEGSDGARIGPCATGMVQSAITVFPPSGSSIESGPLATAALAVDLAIDADGERIYVASAASSGSSTVQSFSRSTLEDPCLTSNGNAQRELTIGVEALPDGRVATLARDAGTLRFMTAHLAALASVELGITVRTSTGFTVFHTMTPSQLACASCHAEAGDDGHTWELGASGGRRTQSLLGGLLATAPFHWDGDQPDMSHVMARTFGEVMGGNASRLEVAALSSWLDAQPAPPGAELDRSAIDRGRGVFVRVSGCAECHAGVTLTNDANLDVGTGGAFQVPSLRGVRLRAPYFHDGCAATLEDVVDGACGTRDHHGRTAGLTARQRGDLLTYLRSL